MPINRGVCIDNPFLAADHNTSAAAAIGSAEDREAGKGGGVYRKLRHWKTVYKIKDWIKT